MSSTGDSEKVVVACGECRRRKWVLPYRVGSAQCCGRPMTREAAVATVSIQCTACRAQDRRLWSLGPGYTCSRCGRSATVVGTAPKPPRPPAPVDGGHQRADVGAPAQTVETKRSVVAAAASFLNDAGVRVSVSGIGLEHGTRAAG